MRKWDSYLIHVPKSQLNSISLKRWNKIQWHLIGREQRERY